MGPAVEKDKGDRSHGQFEVNSSEVGSQKHMKRLGLLVKDNDLGLGF